MYFDFHPTSTGSFTATSSGTWNGVPFNVTLPGSGTLPRDTTPPVLTVPSPIVVDATGPGGAVATFVVTATDDRDPRPAVTASPPRWLSRSGSSRMAGAVQPVSCSRHSSTRSGRCRAGGSRPRRRPR
jgi:hypothetical protein